MYNKDHSNLILGCHDIDSSDILTLLHIIYNANIPTNKIQVSHQMIQLCIVS